MHRKDKNKSIGAAKREKVIGILGGLGPLSTAYLFRRIIELTPSKKDQDHLRIIIDNNPKVPDRTKSILRRDKSIIAHLADTAKNLESAGADFIILACNTSHYYLDEIREKVKVPILNMIKITLDSVGNGSSRPKNVGLLATDGALEKMLYQNAGNGHRINWKTLNRPEQKKLMNIIYQIKAGKDLRLLKDKLKRLFLSLKKKKADCIILGCTELSLFKNMFDDSFKLIDPIEILAAQAIKFSKSFCR